MSVEVGLALALIWERILHDWTTTHAGLHVGQWRITIASGIAKS